MRLFLALLALGLLAAAPARAHDARPFSVNITEQGKGLYAVHIKLPPVIPADDKPSVAWPETCKVESTAPAYALQGQALSQVVRCSAALEGRDVKVVYPIYNPSIPSLFRLKEVSGKVITRVLRPDETVWTVPKSPSWTDVALGYLRLGIEHIWSGIDHLLFVTGLLILAGTVRRVLITITGFTIAHSITLSLSALDIVRLPDAPVEAAIAFSILFLAREIARPHPDGIAARYPILVSSSFGLLHGFGFAAALRDVGLPTNELAAGLFCFNLGVEIGQILFIAAILVALFVARQAIALARVPAIQLHHRLGLICGYGLGIPAAFWFVQRLAAF